MCVHSGIEETVEGIKMQHLAFATQYEQNSIGDLIPEIDDISILLNNSNLSIKRGESKLTFSAVASIRVLD